MSSSYYQMIAKGAVILLAVLVDRRGKSHGDLNGHIFKERKRTCYANLIPALFAAGLLSGAASAAQAADKIALVVSTLNNPFFVTLENGAKAKAKELGYDLIVLDSQNDPAKELANVEDVLNQNIKALLLNPADSDAAKASVQAAIAKNVPVITLDRAANGVDVTSPYRFGQRGGRQDGRRPDRSRNSAAKAMSSSLQGVPGASAARDRNKGFLEAMAAAPGLKVVASQTANFDRTQGLNVMENILQAHPRHRRRVLRERRNGPWARSRPYRRPNARSSWSVSMRTDDAGRRSRAGRCSPPSPSSRR